MIEGNRIRASEKESEESRENVIIERDRNREEKEDREKIGGNREVERDEERELEYQEKNKIRAYEQR